MGQTPNFHFFGYLDYRRLLGDYLKWRRGTKPGQYTFRAVSQRAGFKSPNYVSLIMAGKRNLTPDSTYRLCRALAFGVRESEFFTSLVLFNQSSHPEERMSHFDALVSYRQFAKLNKLAVDKYRYFSRWYHVAIRELMAHEDFTPDAAWIAARLDPPVTQPRVKESLKLLTHLGLVRKSPGGRWRAVEKHVGTEGEVASPFLREFHYEMTRNALRALLQPAHTRKFMAMTMAISKNDFNEISRRMEDFCFEIRQYLTRSTSKPERVCQLNLQMFGLTRNPA